MNLLITEEELNSMKGYKKIVPLQCEECKSTFHASPCYVKYMAKKPYKALNYCCRKCSGVAASRSNAEKRNGPLSEFQLRKKEERAKKYVHKPKVPRETVVCKQCGKSHEIPPYKKKIQVFCSKSCAASWRVAHKTTCNKRSKMEIWIGNQLNLIYPELEIHFCRKDAISAELDIYIPSLRLAFELNGIFHYEPIFGQDQLSRTQNNDKRKFQACLERGIEFCTIDISKVKRFKPEAGAPFLKIVTDIVNSKTERMSEK